MRKERNLGIDLLRIIAMFGIVESHLLAHGGVMNALQTTDNVFGIILIGLLNILCFWPVDAYALCTGMTGYGGRHNIKRLISLHLETFFYSFGISLVFFLLHKCSLKETVRNLMPLLCGRYWYFTAYFFLFLLMPFLDILIQNVNNLKLTIVLAVLCLINAFSFSGDAFSMNFGLSGLWLVIMYIFGAMMGKHRLAERMGTRHLLLLLCAGMMITFAGGMVIPKLTEQYVGISFGEKQFLKFTAPSVLIMAVVLVLLFSKMQIRNIRAVKVIKVLSPLMYGVFLIHEHDVFIDNVYRDRLASLVGSHSTVYTVLALILMGVSLFFACLGIDYLRSVLFRLLKADRLSEYLSVKISDSCNALSGKHRT